MSVQRLAWVVIRVPIVGFAFLVDRLRRLPVAAQLLNHTTAVAAALIATAFVAFLIWGTQPAPERVALADLVAGKLSDMQTWIIVSGELRVEQSSRSTLQYNLTDPAVPNARMRVMSTVELAVGQTTISGRYVGRREPQAEGFPWVGTMQADPVLAPEQPPPWPSLLLCGAGLLIATAGRMSYPVFFEEAPRQSMTRPATLSVTVTRPDEGSDQQPVPGTLQLQPGSPAELLTRGQEQPLRIYPEHMSVDFGEFRGLSKSEPVMRVRHAAGDVDIKFASRDQRDVASAFLAAERRETRRRRLESGEAPSARGL